MFCVFFFMFYYFLHVTPAAVAAAGTQKTSFFLLLSSCYIWLVATTSLFYDDLNFLSFRLNLVDYLSLVIWIFLALLSVFAVTDLLRGSEKLLLETKEDWWASMKDNLDFIKLIIMISFISDKGSWCFFADRNEKLTRKTGKIHFIFLWCTQKKWSFD